MPCQRVENDLHESAPAPKGDIGSRGVFRVSLTNDPVPSASPVLTGGPDRARPTTGPDHGAAGGDVMTRAATAALLVIGGGPAGLAAARAYRENHGAGRVVIVSAESHAPYQRPPLSKDYLRGESGEDELPLVPLDWYDDHQVELLLGSTVRGLDVSGRAVLEDGRALEFDRAVVATGSVPLPPPIPGGERALLLRSRPDASRLRAVAAQASSAVVIGSGFIGCEAAVSLALRGLSVDLVTPEGLPQEKRLGTAVGERIADWLRAAGVRLHLGTSVRELPDARSVLLDSGTPLRADFVLAATGARPATGVARSAGLAMVGNRVAVGSDMRTSSDLIAAVGDIAFAHNDAAGRHLGVEHWGEAERMGEIAGTVLAGGRASWSRAPGFWSGIGDHTLKQAAWGDGWDDARLVDHGDDSFTVWYSRAGRCVGVLTHRADDDYLLGTARVEAGLPSPDRS